MKKSTILGMLGSVTLAGLIGSSNSVLADQPSNDNFEFPDFTQKPIQLGKASDELCKTRAKNNLGYMIMCAGNGFYGYSNFQASGSIPVALQVQVEGDALSKCKLSSDSKSATCDTPPTMTVDFIESITTSGRVTQRSIVSTGFECPQGTSLRVQSPIPLVITSGIYSDLRNQNNNTVVRSRITGPLRSHKTTIDGKETSYQDYNSNSDHPFAVSCQKLDQKGNAQPLTPTQAPLGQSLAECPSGSRLLFPVDKPWIVKKPDLCMPPHHFTL